MCDKRVACLAGGIDVDRGEQEEYALLALIDRLEDLREEMDDLGVSSVAQLEERIAELHRQLDERAGD